MSTLHEILHAAAIGETTDWEFKSARGGFPGSLWQTYSAMANSEGGVIVLGVREDSDRTLRLDGLTPELIASHQKTLWDGLNNRSVVSLNLLDPSHVDVVDVPPAQLLVVHVPRATRTQRPAHLGGNPLGHTYRRSHEGDYRCTDAQVRRMLADADPVPPDHRILPGFTLADLDTVSLRQYRQRALVAKVDHPWLRFEDRELLERLGAWRQDRASGESGLTLAGLLMFGLDRAIRDAHGAPAYFVDYRERLDPSTRWSDRIHPDGTWESNLFQFYGRVWPKLAAALPTPFRLEGATRRDGTPAHEALREAFVNALIHADYAVGGGIVVERLPDRITFANPGTLLVSLEQYNKGGVSECRNAALQQMFLLIGGGEHAGSGADRIRAGWRSLHWRPPQIRVDDQPDRVTLTLPTINLIPDATMRRLRERFHRDFEALLPAELQALATADLEGSVSNARLQELLTGHPVDISRMLQRLCERGLLVSDNRRRWTTYRLGEVQRPLLPVAKAAGGSSPLPPSSSPLPPSSSPLEPSSSGMQPDSIGMQGSGSGPMTLSMDDELRAIAAPVAARGKAAAAVVRATILNLCSGRYLSADQLGTVLHRNPARIQARFLAPMVRDGLLALRFPEAPNRADQAYTTVRRS